MNNFEKQILTTIPFACISVFVRNLLFESILLCFPFITFSNDQMIPKGIEEIMIKRLNTGTNAR
jgi:hypothetical protein